VEAYWRSSAFSARVQLIFLVAQLEHLTCCVLVAAFLGEAVAQDSVKSSRLLQQGIHSLMEPYPSSKTDAAAHQCRRFEGIFEVLVLVPTHATSLLVQIRAQRYTEPQE